MPTATFDSVSSQPLSAPVENEIRRIRVNLERWRWLLHDVDPTFVVVNVAGFQVY